MRSLTDQEHFWRGDFGDQYIARNQGERLVTANLALFTRALCAAGPIDSVLELGTNIGNNLQALCQALPLARLQGVEINTQACAKARALGVAQIWEGSLFDYRSLELFELTLIKGVLIHVAPEMLAQAYEQLYSLSRRYILICEYYNPVPVEVDYRGHTGKLFKRDFAGEMLDCYADLQLLDYGFAYHRDRQFALDDVTWFLLEKRP